MQLRNVVLIDHPVIQTKLTELRDYTADHRKFRALLDEIASLMVYEVLLAKYVPDSDSVSESLLIVVCDVMPL